MYLNVKQFLVKLMFSILPVCCTLYKDLTRATFKTFIGPHVARRPQVPHFCGRVSGFSGRIDWLSSEGIFKS